MDRMDYTAAEFALRLRIAADAIEEEGHQSSVDVPGCTVEFVYVARPGGWPRRRRVFIPGIPERQSGLLAYIFSILGDHSGRDGPTGRDLTAADDLIALLGGRVL